jgi:hypothetical protein
MNLQRALVMGRYRVGLSILPVIAFFLLGFVPACHLWGQGAPVDPKQTIHISPCEDFIVTGRGESAAWNKTAWVPLTRRPGGTLDYRSQFKVLYSKTGIYVLFEGEDKKLTATMREDFLDLWNEDVFECFFWTDEAHTVYFEYEISPLGYELPILIPNLNGKFLGWRPWHYEGERKTTKAVTVLGGPQESGAAISGWRAEVFFPYDLFRPLQNVPPKTGALWRANFYRVDYDADKATSWDWARVGSSFHDFRNFGTLVFD